MATLAINVAIQEDGNTIFVTDEGTVWGTPDRSGIMLMCYVKYNAISGSEVISDTGDFNYDVENDNNTVTSFAIPYTVDGWHSFHLIIVPTTAADSEGAIKYNTSASELQIYEDGDWIELESSRWDLLLTEDFTYITQESMLYSKLAIKVNCLWDDIVAKKCKDMKCASDKFWFMRGQTYSLLNQFYIGNRYEAQKMIENVNQYADNIS